MEGRRMVPTRTTWRRCADGTFEPRPTPTGTTNASPRAATTGPHPTSAPTTSLR